MSTLEAKSIESMMQVLPTREEVNRISALMEPINRNLQITACYSDLSAAFVIRTGQVANWCTFATWASKQAGVTIRKEDLRRKMEEILSADPLITAMLELIHSYAKKIGTSEIHERIHLDTLNAIITSASEKASDAVARGNKKVFEEIGFEFARFISNCLTDEQYNESTISSFCSTLKPGLPPDGQYYLCNAFTRYYKAFFEQAPKNQDELILMANIEIGFHEQTRLQPEIAASLNAAMVNQKVLFKYVTDLLVTHSNMKGKIYYFLQWVMGRTNILKKFVSELVTIAQEHLRILLTKNLMTLNLPPADCLHLGDDLIKPYPEDLITIENTELLELLQQLKPGPDFQVGKGCTDWADLKQRIFYIANLFRCYHENNHLFNQAFTSEQLEIIRKGEIPGSL